MEARVYVCEKPAFGVGDAELMLAAANDASLEKEAPVKFRGEPNTPRQAFLALWRTSKQIQMDES